MAGPEHRPGDPVPTPGVYHELNVFGTPTGRAVLVAHGELLPQAPHGFRWRAAEDDPSSGAGYC